MTSAPTVISGFSGGGLADIGYRMAGFRPIGAIEYDPAIAAVYRANLGDHVRVESIMETPWHRLERPTLLHVSPECKEFSQAKTRGAEGPVQRAQAEAICLAIRTLRPPLFVLENVQGYRRSESLARILATLDDEGYGHTTDVANAADFGVPQTRKRLIIRASLLGPPPPLPLPRPWVGWHAAIADLIPTLPDSSFAPWQLARLEPLLATTLVERQCAPDYRPLLTAGGGVRGGRPRANHRADECATGFLVHPTEMRSTPIVEGGDTAFTLVAAGHGLAHNPTPYPRALLVSSQSIDGEGACARADDQPAVTVGTNAGRQRAFIVDGKANNNGERVTVRDDGEPCFTVVAQHATRQAARAWLDRGRVVAMTPRALARFQSVPDDYALPERRALACTVVGNGVPCLLAAAIGHSLRGLL